MASFLQTGDFLLRGLSSHHHGAGENPKAFALHRRPASRLVTSFALIGAQSKLQNEANIREGQSPFGDTPLKNDDFSTAPKSSIEADDAQWEIDISEEEWGVNAKEITQNIENHTDDDWSIKPANDSDDDLGINNDITEYTIDTDNIDDDDDTIDDDLVDQLLAELDFDFDYDFEEEEEGSSGGGGGISHIQEEEKESTNNSISIEDFSEAVQEEKPNFDDLIRRVCTEVEHHKGGQDQERSSLVKKHLNNYMQDFKADMMHEYEEGSLLWFGAWLLDSSRNRCWLELRRQTEKGGKGKPKANNQKAA